MCNNKNIDIFDKEWWTETLELNEIKIQPPLKLPKVKLELINTIQDIIDYYEVNKKFKFFGYEDYEYRHLYSEYFGKAQKLGINPEKFRELWTNNLDKNNELVNQKYSEIRQKEYQENHLPELEFKGKIGSPLKPNDYYLVNSYHNISSIGNWITAREGFVLMPIKDFLSKLNIKQVEIYDGRLLPETISNYFEKFSCIYFKYNNQPVLILLIETGPKREVYTPNGFIHFTNLKQLMYEEGGINEILDILELNKNILEIKILGNKKLKVIKRNDNWYTLQFPGGETEQFYFNGHYYPPLKIFSIYSSREQEIDEYENLFKKYKYPYRRKDKNEFEFSSDLVNFGDFPKYSSIEQKNIDSGMYKDENITELKDENNTQSLKQELLQLVKNNIENISGLYKYSIEDNINTKPDLVIDTIISQVGDDLKTGIKIFGKEVANLAWKINKIENPEGNPEINLDLYEIKIQGAPEYLLPQEVKPGMKGVDYHEGVPENQYTVIKIVPAKDWKLVRKYDGSGWIDDEQEIEDEYGVDLNDDWLVAVENNLGYFGKEYGTLVYVYGYDGFIVPRKGRRLKEIKITRGPKTWDLDKPGVKFEKIQVGDIIQFMGYSQNTEQNPIIVKYKVDRFTEFEHNYGATKYPVMVVSKVDNPRRVDSWTKDEIEGYWRRNSIKESKLPQNERKELIKKFIKFTIDELGLQRPLKCKIKLTSDKSLTQTYGHFEPETETIVVYNGNRSLGDILRTLGHELVHRKQDQDGKLTPNSGETGSPIENEANSLSGVLLRKFGEIYPSIFENKQSNKKLLK